MPKQGVHVCNPIHLEETVERAEAGGVAPEAMAAVGASALKLARYERQRYSIPLRCTSPKLDIFRSLEAT